MIARAGLDKVGCIFGVVGDVGGDCDGEAAEGREIGGTCCEVSVKVGEVVVSSSVVEVRD